MKQKIKLGIQLIPLMVITLAMCFTGTGITWAGNANKFVSGELLIQPKAGVSKNKIDKLLESHGAATLGEIKRIKVRKIKVPVQALEKVEIALEKNPNISFVEKNYLAEPGYVPDDSDYPSQWYLPKIQAPGGWDMETGSTDVPIAIIDSGVDPTHPDLEGKLIAGYNFLQNNTDTQDVLGHGTAVAGTAAAMSNNYTGIAGVAWNDPIMPLVVLNANDYASYYDIARAITYAADKGIRVINISIGGSSSSSTLQNAVNYAWNKGAVIFACAMNNSTDAPYYPAACANVVSVSATTSSDTLASFSDYGDWIDISAPGVSILTTNRGGGYGRWNGTSFSSPIAAGVAALVLSANPSLTNDQVVNIIKQNADDLGAVGYDPYFGYGRVNAYRSLLAALSTTPAPDTSAPSVAINTPQTGATVSGQITVGVSAIDNVGVERVELYIDGNELAADTTAPYQFVWDTTSYNDGNYDLQAIAYDSAGNQGYSASIGVSVHNNVITDNVPPVVTIVAPKDGDSISGRQVVEISASDDNGINSLALSIDGQPVKTITNKNDLRWNWNTRKESQGPHTISAMAVDTAGNVGEQSITVYK